jgi:hypothetical protein
MSRRASTPPNRTEPLRRADAVKRSQPLVDDASWGRISDVVMPADLCERVAQSIAQATLQLLQKEGLDAFSMPRSAAIAHEAGHCVVGEASKLDIVSTGVFEHLGQWAGITNEASGWHLDPDTTPTASVLTRIRFMVAGVVGEMLFDAVNYRHGSSLNEIILSQMMAAGLLQGRGSEFPGIEHPHDLWCRCWQETGAILERNALVMRKLMAKLDRDEQVRGIPLKAVLRRVVP